MNKVLNIKPVRLESRTPVILTLSDNKTAVILAKHKGDIKLFKIDAEDVEFCKGFSYSVNGAGYLQATKLATGKNKQIFLHRVLLNIPEGLEADHINGDRSDNRRSNLRIVDAARNMQNRRKKKNTASSYKGVYLNRARNNWHTYISLNGKRLYGGAFKTDKEAAKRYDELATKYFGEYARINNL